MPPRWLCFVVVALWLAITGWLVWDELRDEFAVDEPPPFVIDLVDEARPDQARIRWLVWQGDDPPDATLTPRVTISDIVALLTAPVSSPLLLTATSFLASPPFSTPISATSWLEHHEKPDDTFSLHVFFHPNETLHRRLEKNDESGTRWLDLGPIKLKRMESVYRVDREGKFLGAEASFVFDAHGISNNRVRLKGEVQGGLFQGKVLGEYPFLFEKELTPVPVSRRGSVLLPMHPVNKIRGLRLGQTWTIRMIDPLSDSMKFTRDDSFSGRMIRARVLPELQLLPVLSKERFGVVVPTQCLVIEYEGEDKIKPRTWVRAADGLVLRQESSIKERRLVMQRHLIPDVTGEP